jgi:hypothetical protein
MSHRTMMDVFGFRVDRQVEMDAVRAQIADAATEIRTRLAAPDLACEIYDAHVRSDDEHSCLGCNLNDSVHELADFLACDVDTANALTHLHLSLHLVNTLWERISDVCEAIDLPKTLWRDGEQNFPSFKTARSWANFLKHPGFFGMGIHHPIVVAAGGAAARDAGHADAIRSSSEEPEWVLIDTDFVRAYWSRDHTGNSVKEKLERPFTACVLLPNLAELSKGVCREFETFIHRMQEPTWVEQARKFALFETPCDWWE